MKRRCTCRPHANDIGEVEEPVDLTLADLKNIEVALRLRVEAAEDCMDDDPAMYKAQLRRYRPAHRKILLLIERVSL
jgi:hypothetical protein